MQAIYSVHLRASLILVNPSYFSSILLCEFAGLLGLSGSALTIFKSNLNCDFLKFCITKPAIFITDR